jgi:protein involved in ribonucleotide reduction
MPVELVFGINCFLFVGYSEYCAFIRVEFHADQHINYITSKTNKTLRFLRRNLKIPSIRINEQAYFTLARPLVEYASTIWDPYTQTDINKVEAVQRRAARYVANNHRKKTKSFICFAGNIIYVLVPL